MDKQTNIERIEAMLYHTCGCSPYEAILVLQEALTRAKQKYHKQSIEQSKARYKKERMMTNGNTNDN